MTEGSAFHGLETDILLSDIDVSLIEHGDASIDFPVGGEGFVACALVGVVEFDLGEGGMVVALALVGINFIDDLDRGGEAGRDAVERQIYGLVLVVGKFAAVDV